MESNTWWLQSRHRVVAWMIRWSVPILNVFRRPSNWPYTVADLRKFRAGSLGREVAHFLDGRQLGFLPNSEGHDCFHALLGYGSSVTDELKLQAFMWGNGNATRAGCGLFFLGWFVFPSKHRALRREMDRGRRARSLGGIDLVQELYSELAGMREDLCIV